MTAKEKRLAPLRTPTRLSEEAVRDLSSGLNALLADTFAVYLKTKNFHWHVSGPSFRDYHLLLDEQAAELLAITDPMAERVRKIGGTTLRSLGQASSLSRVKDNDEAYVDPIDMLAELRDDNADLINRMMELHALSGEHGDVGTTSLIENWVEEAERRVWFLFETARRGNA